MKYYENYQNVTEAQSEQMLLEKWCSTQGCHEPICKQTNKQTKNQQGKKPAKNLSAKHNKAQETRYACV